MILTKLIVNQAANYLAKHFKLEKVMSYVFDKNDADERIDALEEENKEMKIDIQFLKKLLTKEK